MEKHQDWDGVCLDCGEGISHPICPHCLEQELMDWANIVAPDMALYFKGIVSSTDLSGDENNFCIFCGRSFNRCTFCITQEIIKLLQTEKPELVNMFIEQFGTYIEFVPIKEVLAM